MEILLVLDQKTISLTFLLALSPVLQYVEVNGELHSLKHLLITCAILIVIQFLIIILSFALIQFFLKGNVDLIEKITAVIGILWLCLMAAVPYRQNNLPIPTWLFIIYFLILIFLLVLIAWRWSQKLKQGLLVFLMAFCASKVWGMSQEMLNAESKPQNESQAIHKGTFDFSIDQGSNPFSVKRNIYHILVDSYPSLEGIKRFGIDNSQFYQELEKREFKTWKNAFSNYPATVGSMIALWTMNLSYPNIDRIAYYGGNEVFARLIAQGYFIYCGYPCFGEAHAPKPVSPKIIQLGNLEINLVGQYYLQYYLGQTLTTFFFNDAKLLNNEVADRYRGFQKTGNEPALFYFHDLSIPAKKAERLAKFNNSLLNMFDHIQANDPEAIIILSSDHGNRSDWVKTPFSDTPLDNFGIMMAVKFPKECEQLKGVQTLTPVNLYRYVFACLENKPTPEKLEPNHSYMWGKTWAYAWDSSKDRTFYLYIKNGIILDEPQPTNQKF